MAGIGFRLEKILEGDTYLASTKAHFYSTFICSGPWILSVISLALLSNFAPAGIDIFELSFFRISVIYAYAFSLITAGVLYLSLNRYLADKLFLKDEAAIIPAFNTASFFVLCLGMVVVLGFIFLSPDPFSLKLPVSLLYLVLSLIWCVSIFLTTLRDYRSIAASFIGGFALTVFLSFYWGGLWGLEGYLWGYGVGHFFILVFLSSRIFIEFSTEDFYDVAFFSFLKNNFYLTFTGVLYNLAVWVDKIIFWISPRSINVSKFFRSFPHYETALFLAYLTIIPALSVFLIHIETNFYKKYRNFYSIILARAPYSQINKARQEMAFSLRKGIFSLLISQGIISFLTISYAESIISFLRVPLVEVPLFRVATLGAYLHSLILLLLIIMLYFDFKKDAFYLSFMFFASNGLFTYIYINKPLVYLGYAYFFSTFITVVLGYYLFNWRLNNILYYTFAKQPVAMHRQEEIV